MSAAPAKVEPSVDVGPVDPFGADSELLPVHPPATAAAASRTGSIALVDRLVMARVGPALVCPADGAGPPVPS